MGRRQKQSNDAASSRAKWDIQTMAVLFYYTSKALRNTQGDMTSLADKFHSIAAKVNRRIATTIPAGKPTTIYNNTQCQDKWENSKKLTYKYLIQGKPKAGETGSAVAGNDGNEKPAFNDKDLQVISLYLEYFHDHPSLNQDFGKDTIQVSKEATTRRLAEVSKGVAEGVTAVAKRSSTTAQPAVQSSAKASFVAVPAAEEAAAKVMADAVRVAAEMRATGQDTTPSVPELSDDDLASPPSPFASTPGISSSDDDAHDVAHAKGVSEPAPRAAPTDEFRPPYKKAKANHAPAPLGTQSQNVPEAKPSSSATVTQAKEQACNAIKRKQAMRRTPLGPIFLSSSGSESEFECDKENFQSVPVPGANKDPVSAKTNKMAWTQASFLNNYNNAAQERQRQQLEFAAAEEEKRRTYELQLLKMQTEQQMQMQRMQMEMQRQQLEAQERSERQFMQFMAALFPRSSVPAAQPTPAAADTTMPTATSAPPAAPAAASHNVAPTDAI